MPKPRTCGYVSPVTRNRCIRNAAFHSPFCDAHRKITACITANREARRKRELARERRRSLGAGLSQTLREIEEFQTRNIRQTLKDFGIGRL